MQNYSILLCAAMILITSEADAQHKMRPGSAADTPIDLILRADTLAERAETRRDARLLVAAACASASAGRISSVKLPDTGDEQIPRETDTLDPSVLLERANILKTTDTRAAVDAARDVWRKGSFLTDACGLVETDQQRGTQYLFKASGLFKRGEPRRVMLPPVNPSEPLHIVARADVYGQITIKLIDASGRPICSSSNKPRREVRCFGMTPRSTGPLKGYAIEVENSSRLHSKVQIYAN
mgnify:FL=1